jgi:hypothetical protein
MICLTIIICFTIINESYISYSMNICRDHKPIVCLIMSPPYATSYQNLVYLASKEYMHASRPLANLPTLPSI